MAWSEVQAVDGPRRCPHIVQRAAMVRRVAQAEAASDWMTYGKVSTRRICNIPATPGLTIVTSDSYLGS
jgi:hypothetical protein